MWRRRCFHGINAMILMPQIFDVTANENARYKRNEFEWLIMAATSSKAAREITRAYRDVDERGSEGGIW